MGKEDISQLPFANTCDLSEHISRGKARTRKISRDPLLSGVKKSTTGTVSRQEIGSLLDNFKTYILGSLSEKIDSLKIQNKKKAEKAPLSIFCPRYIKKHSLRECPLDLKSIETCAICVENHDTK